MNLQRLSLPVSALTMIAAVGCSTPGRNVSFTVSRAVDGTPVHVAQVRAAPVGTSPLPLPVSAENLAKAGEAQGDSSYTDENGRVSLRLGDYRYLIEVSDAPFEAEHKLSTWYWNGATGELESVGEARLLLTLQPGL